jgi:ribosomal protein L35AE/L33A
MTKGTVVYISGAAGNKAVVSKAIATGDATSAQTMGIITANIPNNQNGYATVFGQLVGLDTSAFAEGAQLYLSSTVAGNYTNVKQYAPAHLVYVGIVTRSHQNQGAIEVRIQNGYEIDELHNVSARSPANNDLLKFNSSTNLWEKYQGASGSFTTVDLKTITVVGGLITSIA